MNLANPELRRLLVEAFATQKAAELEDALAARGVPAARVRHDTMPRSIGRTGGTGVSSSLNGDAHPGPGAVLVQLDALLPDSLQELEVVLDETEPHASGEATAKALLTQLGISQEQLVAKAYVDLLAGQ